MSLKRTCVVLSELIVFPTRSESRTALSICTRSFAKCRIRTLPLVGVA